MEKFRILAYMLLLAVVGCFCMKGEDSSHGGEKNSLYANQRAICWHFQQIRCALTLRSRKFQPPQRHFGSTIGRAMAFALPMFGWSKATKQVSE